MRMSLERLATSEQARVLDIEGGWCVRQRLRSLGLNPGDLVEVVRSGFLGGGLVVRDLDTNATLALGMGEASCVTVERLSPAEPVP